MAAPPPAPAPPSPPPPPPPSPPGDGRRSTGERLIAELATPPTRPADARKNALTALREACARFGDRAAVRYPGAREGQLETITYANLWKRVAELALGLRAAGVAQDDRVLIMTENGPEALIAELATIANRALSVVLFPTYPVDVLRGIAAAVEPKVAIVESGAPLARFLEARRDAQDKLKVISFGDGVPGPRGEIRPLSPIFADGRRRLDRSLAEGKGDAFEALLARVSYDDAIAIAYSAGTTGAPRGAVLTHANVLGGDLGVLVGHVTPHDTGLVAIPLAQPFARLTVCYGLLRAGASVAPCPPGDGLLPLIERLQPTGLFLAPGAIEPLEAEIKRRVTLARGLNRRVIDWALARARSARAEGAKVPFWVDRFVLGRIRARLGRRIRYAFVGGAADGNVLSFFQDLGVDTYEGYAITEATPCIAVNRPEREDANRYGSGVVGRVAPGVDIAIDDDGEIRARGLVLMREYWRDPAATRRALWGGGWIRTGDVGYVNKNGYIVVEDRKADLLRLADGRYVCPALVEAVLGRSPLVREIVVIGRGRPFVSALVLPSFQELAARVHASSPELAKRSTRRELMSNPASRLQIEMELLGRSIGIPDYARPRKARLISMPFSVGNELTPWGTPRRRAIEDRFKLQIDALYTEKSGLPKGLTGADSGGIPVTGDETQEMAGLRAIKPV